MKELTDYEDCPLCLMLAQTEGLRVAVPYDELARIGVSLPPAETLDDAQLARKIEQIVDGLAALNVCIAHTDHLSDRALYRHLCEEVLRDPTEIFFGSERGVTTIDLIGGGSEEHIEIYLTYYADDEDRRRWQRDFPDHPMPEKREPAADRDRFLPSLETLHAREVSSMDH